MEHIDKLKSCCDEGLHTVIQGTASTDEEVALVYMDADNKLHRLPRQHEDHEFKSLLATCSPAKFGKDKETVYDQEYRDCLQLTAD
jgi:hypothetical protein